MGWQNRAILTSKKILSFGIAIYAILIFPVHVLAESSSDIYQKNSSDEKTLSQLIERFTELREEIRLANHRFLEAFCSLSSLIQEVNAIHKMSFTMRDVVDAAKMQVEQSGFDSEVKNNLFKVIENLNSIETSVRKEKQTPLIAQALSIDLLVSRPFFPWTWNWFKPIKKKLKPLQHQTIQIIHPTELPSDDLTISDDLIIAGVEFLAAGLLFIIPSGTSQTIGAVLLGDAIMRTWKDLLEQPNRLPPSNYKD